MSLTTYAELKTTIADFLDRTDLTSNIPTFIQLAEARMSRDIRHWRMENRATAEVDGQYSALPSDFLEPIRLHLESPEYRQLELANQFQMQDLRARSADTAGKPQYYALTQGELEVYPIPNQTYNLEMNYYQKIPALSDSNTSNWVLANYPDVYLYGALVHSAPFLHEDQRITVWEALNKSAIDAINVDNQRSKTGGTGRRMKIRAY